MSTGVQFSNSLAAADIATGLHPYTNARLHEVKGPLIMGKGQGIYVYDVNAKQYIESFAGLWSVAIGFSEPREPSVNRTGTTAGNITMSLRCYTGDFGASRPKESILAFASDRSSKAGLQW